MSRYIFNRGVEGTVFLIPEWPWVPYKNMEVICIQFVYKNCTQIYSIVPNVYLMYTSKIQTGNVIDLLVFFLYSSKRMCTKSIQQIRIW